MNFLVLLQQALVVSLTIVLFWKLTEHAWGFLNTKKPIRVLVTGAAGQIGYAIVPMIAKGTMLGPAQPVILHTLDPSAEALNGVRMELVDAAFPILKEENVTCLTRLDHNRALGQVSERLDVHVSDAKNVIIWGNHSSTQYPDVNHATVVTNNVEKPARDLVANDHCCRKLSSALSAASSACDHIRDSWTPKGTWVSMGVYSDGSYGIQPSIIYSFPVTCHNGEWSIVQGNYSRAKMDATEKELIDEKSLAYSCLT